MHKHVDILHDCVAHEDRLHFDMHGHTISNATCQQQIGQSKIECQFSSGVVCKEVDTALPGSEKVRNDGRYVADEQMVVAGRCTHRGRFLDAKVDAVSP